MAPDLAFVYDHTRLLRNDSDGQGQSFQEKSQYFPLSDFVRDTFSLRRFRLRNMAPGLDAVFDRPRILHDRKRDKIQVKSKKQIEDPPKNMGGFVYLFIFSW